MQKMRVPVRSLLSGKAASSERLIDLYYHKNNDTGGIQPTVVYVPGFMSLGRATKSQFMASHCQARGWDYVCYDPEGIVDMSTETQKDQPIIRNFETLKFSHWFDDCYTAVQKVKETKPDDPILLVGSSMGGWISLKMAVTMPELIKGMLLIAPATNFMRKKYQQEYHSLSKDQQSKLDKGETVVSMTPYGYMPIAKRFSEESVEVELDLTKPLEIQCPVRILHGMLDDVVPYEHGIKLSQLIASSDIDVTLRKSGDHRLCHDKDLELIGETMDKLVHKISNK